MFRFEFSVNSEGYLSLTGLAWRLKGYTYFSHAYKGPLGLCLGGRSTMLKDEDLLEWLICYGRTPVQDYITRSPNIRDAVQYLQLERNIEMISPLVIGLLPKWS